MAKNHDKYSSVRLKTSYITTVISISLVLFMLGLLGLIVLHAKKLSDYVKENISLTVFLKENVKDAELIQFRKTLDAASYVKSTEHISKEKAAADLTKELGEDFVTFLGYNPLSASIDVHLKADYANNDSLSWIEKNIKKNEFVKEVSYQKSLVQMVNENLRKISLIIVGFGSLLLLIAIALINNTIRLSVYSKRFLIKSMQLIGATQGFIRKPFLINGIIQGLISSFITIGMLAGILYFSQKNMPELVQLQDINMFFSLFVIVTIVGLMLTWISTYFAVRKYLKINTDSLYYY